MKNWRSNIAITMTMIMAVASSSAFATAAPAAPNTTNTTTPPTATAPKEVRSSLRGLAVVEALNGDKQVTVKIEDQQIVLNLSNETLFIHAVTGLPSSAKDLKVGDSIFVYYSAAMTRSLPPQSSAVAVVTGVEKDKTIPQLMTVKELSNVSDKSIRFLNTDEDMFVTLLKENPITPFKTKQIVNIKDVQPGSKVFVWFDIVLMSYPGQTTATKTVFVGNEITETKAPTKTPTKVVIDNVTLDLGKLKIVEKNGKYLVPLKAVSKALGFNLKWDAKAQSASIDDGSVKTTITVGRDAYYKASSKAIGLTNNFSYGAAPEIINGSMYVPTDLFKLLYSNEAAVKVSGETIFINKNTK